MYLRFTLKVLEGDSGYRRGVLVAAHELRDHGDLSVDEHRELQESLAWFNLNLNHPACLADPANRRAISWFKPEARKPISRMWALKAILERHGFVIDVHKTDDPGLVIFEDGWQVIAKPPRGEQVPW
jgi:hypothetical protein